MTRPISLLADISDNVMVGYAVGQNLTGIRNTLVGFSSGYAVGTGQHNSAFGANSMTNASGSKFGVAVGSAAMQQGGGENNVAVGYCALFSVKGTGNIGIGSNAGYYITTGSQNVALGQLALFRATTANRNVGIGFSALTNITSGEGNVAIGTDAGRNLTAADSNTFIGWESGSANTTGASNVAVGRRALYLSSTAGYNVAVGVEAMLYTTTGRVNTAVGYQALKDNLVGDGNAAVGNQALVYNLGSYNSALGEKALDGNTTGNFNTGLGSETGYIQATGSDNTYVGAKAGRGIEASANVSGATGDGTTVTFTNTPWVRTPVPGTSVFVTQVSPTAYNGKLTIVSATSTTTTVASTVTDAYVSGGLLNLRHDVSGSTLVGFETMLDPHNGADYNTALGWSALHGVTTGANNIAIGKSAGDRITSGSRNIAMGDASQVDSPTDDDQINIGERYFHDRIRLIERSADPDVPPEGNCVVWMSNGTGLGDDGDILIASKVGGVTKWGVLFAHSGGESWYGPELVAGFADTWTEDPDDDDWVFAADSVRLVDAAGTSQAVGPIDLEEGAYYRVDIEVTAAIILTLGGGTPVEVAGAIGVQTFTMVAGPIDEIRITPDAGAVLTVSSLSVRAIL